VSEGKVSPGDIFQPPPAAIWNNMVDAGRAWADQRFSNSTPEPTRPRQTDLIKLKNNSEAPRKKGEILKIDGKAIEDITGESIWLLGVEPTADCRFGILKYPADGSEEAGDVVDCHVSGACIARVNVTNEFHTHAVAVDGEYLLQSSFGGGVEILFAPPIPEEDEYPQELDCVVRFADRHTMLAVILDAALTAATHALTGASSCLATICEWNTDTDQYAESTHQITVWNHSESKSYDDDTFGIAKFIQGHWLFFGDCAGMTDREES
jgi:hypothetical protein